MKPITHFKDIDGLEVDINPAAVFVVRRLSNSKAKTGETVIEIISIGGASISIIEPADRVFHAFFREAFEGGV